MSVDAKKYEIEQLKRDQKDTFDAWQRDKRDFEERLAREKREMEEKRDREKQDLLKRVAEFESRNLGPAQLLQQYREINELAAEVNNMHSATTRKILSEERFVLSYKQETADTLESRHQDHIIDMQRKSRESENGFSTGKFGF